VVVVDGLTLFRELPIETCALPPVSSFFPGAHARALRRRGRRRRRRRRRQRTKARLAGFPEEEERRGKARGRGIDRPFLSPTTVFNEGDLLSSRSRQSVEIPLKILGPGTKDVVDGHYRGRREATTTGPAHICEWWAIKARARVESVYSSLESTTSASHFSSPPPPSLHNEEAGSVRARSSAVKRAFFARRPSLQTAPTLERESNIG